MIKVGGRFVSKMECSDSRMADRGQSQANLSGKFYMVRMFVKWSLGSAALVGDRP